jgi:hypothetical protein
VECGLLLDVVVGQGAAILQLLASEDQTLLVRGDAWTGTAAQNSRCMLRPLQHMQQVALST